MILLTKAFKMVPLPVAKPKGHYMLNQNSERLKTNSNMKRICRICLEEVDVIKMFPILTCRHMFCRPCMRKHAEVNLLQGKLPRCPGEGCSFEIKMWSCRSLVKPEFFEKLSQRVKEASIPAKDKIYCPNPKCSALMSKSETKYFGASRCVKYFCRFCRQCKVLWHNNMTCMDYKKLHPFEGDEDAKLNSLAKEKMWRQCMMCKSMIELARGCNHIHCRCGYEFCYKCGVEWKDKNATCKCPLWDERMIIYNRH